MWWAASPARKNAARAVALATSAAATHGSMPRISTSRSGTPTGRAHDLRAALGVYGSNDASSGRLMRKPQRFTLVDDMMIVAPQVRCWMR
jgi:hypothetical protein